MEPRQYTIYTDHASMDSLLATYIVAKSLGRENCKIVPVMRDRPFTINDHENVILIYGKNMPIEAKSNIEIINSNNMARQAFNQYKCANQRLSDIIEYIDQYTVESDKVDAALAGYSVMIQMDDTQEMIWNRFASLDSALKLDSELLPLIGQGCIMETQRVVAEYSTYASICQFTVDKPYKVAVSQTRMFRNQIGKKMIANHQVDFAICWELQLETGNYHLILISSDNLTDVGEICRRLGGIGNHNSGFCIVKNFPQMITTLKS